ncbi:MAG: hypothetical protein NC231_13510 [Bacillus sp. (in: Bacteria)]|nr:hypothetical protein [Bacillus sp. (in: firmicutes)]MCM1428008.1 hypothetical protein [Eubacterium sp.]
MEQVDLAAVASLLDQEKDRLAGFKKETYADSFAAYLEDNSDVWSGFRRLFAMDGEPVKEAGEVAVCLTDKMQEILNAQKNKWEKDEKQLNVNLYMVSYFFPALLSCREYPGKDGGVVKMADVICKKWNETFRPHTIQYADFNAIQSGFKQKLCYVTTAVCCGLQKGADCREIMLMKKYRDEYIEQQPDGEALIEEYYDIAPTIVKRIAKESSPEEKYRYLWEHYLQYCVAMIEAGQYRECLETYTAMMNELKEKYLITNHREDKK